MPCRWGVRDEPSDAVSEPDEALEVSKLSVPNLMSQKSLSESALDKLDPETRAAAAAVLPALSKAAPADAGTGGPAQAAGLSSGAAAAVPKEKSLPEGSVKAAAALPAIGVASLSGVGSGDVAVFDGAVTPGATPGAAAQPPSPGDASLPGAGKEADGEFSGGEQSADEDEDRPLALSRFRFKLPKVPKWRKKKAAAVAEVVDDGVAAAAVQDAAGERKR